MVLVAALFSGLLGDGVGAVVVGQRPVVVGAVLVIVAGARPCRGQYVCKLVLPPPAGVVRVVRFTAANL